MYLQRSNNLNFHILLAISVIAHLFALILLPGIRDRDILKEDEIKKIKAGLVVLKDDTKKKTASVKKKVAKKEEVKKQITKVKKEPKKAEKKPTPKKIEKKVEKKVPEKAPEKVVPEPKKEIAKPVLSAIKRKSTRSFDATSVLSVEKTSISRDVTKSEKLPLESTNISNVNSAAVDRKIINFETEESKEVREVTEIKDFKIETEKRDLKIIKPVETLNDTRTLDSDIEIVNTADLGGEELEISLPKNIIPQLIEGSGTVEWPESNRLPDYPSEAERKALNGEVSVILQYLDGSTVYQGIEKKSGYTLIDRAVEKVARTWGIRIKSDGGLLVNGKVRITVKFDFE